MSTMYCIVFLYLQEGRRKYVLTRIETKAKRKRRSMDSKRKPIPRLNSEDEEREFWATHDSTEYIDWSKAERNPTLSRLKPSTWLTFLSKRQARHKT